MFLLVKKNLYGGFIKHNKLFIMGGGEKMLATTFHQQFFFDICN